MWCLWMMIATAQPPAPAVRWTMPTCPLVYETSGLSEGSDLLVATPMPNGAVLWQSGAETAPGAFAAQGGVLASSHRTDSGWSVSGHPGDLQESLTAILSDLSRGSSPPEAVSPGAAWQGLDRERVGVQLGDEEGLRVQDHLRWDTGGPPKASHPTYTERGSAEAVAVISRAGWLVRGRYSASAEGTRHAGGSLRASHAVPRTVAVTLRLVQACEGPVLPREQTPTVREP